MNDIDPTVGFWIILGICIIWAVFAFLLRRVGFCEICKNKFNADNMAHHKVCMNCWYSDDEAAQDRAYEIATGGKYGE